jgi:hypothetical protein
MRDAASPIHAVMGRSSGPPPVCRWRRDWGKVLQREVVGNYRGPRDWVVPDLQRQCPSSGGLTAMAAVAESAEPPVTSFSLLLAF